MDERNDGFLQWVLAELDRMAEEDARLVNDLRELEEQRQAIAQKRQQLAQNVEQLKTAEAVYHGWKTPSSNGGSPRSAEAPASLPSAAELAGMTVADGAEAIMRTRGGKAAVTDLAQILHAAGKFKDARSGYTVVYPTLNKAPTRFRRLDKGTWGLVELFGADDGDQPDHQESDELGLDAQRA